MQSAPDLPPDDSLTVPDAWFELLDALTGDTGAVMIVGATDTGKTVLAWWLAERLAERAPTAIADSDLGQSVLGPPGTVGWRTVGGEAEEFVFVGVTSPATRPLGTATATWRVRERARQHGAAWLVLDTSGYVDGSGAVALKRAKLDLVRPTDVVLIEDEPARLQPIARAIRPGEARVHRLVPAAVVEARSPAHRRRWRQGRFQAYLARATVRRIALEGRAIYGGDPRRWARAREELGERLQGLLVGLSDAEGIGVAIGLLRGIGPRAESLLVLAPPVDDGAIAAVSLGTIRLREDGTQIIDET